MLHAFLHPSLALCSCGCARACAPLTPKLLQLPYASCLPQKIDVGPTFIVNNRSSLLTFSAPEGTQGQAEEPVRADDDTNMDSSPDDGMLNV